MEEQKMFKVSFCEKVDYYFFFNPEQPLFHQKRVMKDRTVLTCCF